MEQNQVENQDNGQNVQRKVAGFDKAILTYRKIAAEAQSGIISKRKEEFVAYVRRVVFNDGDDAVVTPPDLETQQRVVERMKDLK